MTTTDSARIARSRTILQHAQWAARVYAEYDHARVTRIVGAVADAAQAHARKFAEQSVAETGFGVVEDKIAKKEAVPQGFLAEYGDLDYCGHRVDSDAKQILVPRPAGVILALTPSTSPVGVLYFKVLSALLTRNAIVVSPHPSAAKTGVEAAEVLAKAAADAGAPDGVIQVIAEPTVPLIESMMADERVDLILATGGSAVVRAAYRSGTPALGVGPGNPPVLVDETADLDSAAESIVTSKAFDNSVLCTAESVLIMMEPIARQLTDLLKRKGAHLCTSAETAKVRDYVYPAGRFNGKVVGLSARELAKRAGFEVAAQTRLLLTPIDSVFDEEPLTHEKLCPVLAVRTVGDFARGIREAKSLLRIVGVGHSAVIHSRNSQHVLDFSLALPVHRMTVNAPGSLGSAGMGTTLPISMSIGTGFAGGSSLGENLQPQHLVQWVRAAYADIPSVEFPDFSGLNPSEQCARGDRVPPYPEPSNAKGAPVVGASRTVSSNGDGMDALREDLRRIVLEELRDLIGAR